MCKNMAKKIQVMFSERQIEILRRFRGIIGDTDADVVRSIVMAWLAEKNIISAFVQEHTNIQTSTQPSAQSKG